MNARELADRLTNRDDITSIFYYPGENRYFNVHTSIEDAPVPTVYTSQDEFFIVRDAIRRRVIDGRGHVEPALFGWIFWAKRGVRCDT